LLQNGTDLSKIVSIVIDFFVNLFRKSPSTPFKKVHKNYNKPVAKPTSKIITKDKTQQQIDEILDKISRSGYDCLTKEEKEFLFKAGK
ncbi:MAG: rhomboid family intramembrane serine protease, partial [Flavobacteriaceae bacterium]|nr:rhomboid family intramembrane serine protease [Flavobacteriaceae bacterium]